MPAVRHALLVLVIAATPANGQAPTYADAATEALVALARERHRYQDSLVRDYRAHVLTRVDASAGRSRFARLFPLLAHETAADLTWRRPNDLHLEVLGVRQRSVFTGMRSEIAYDRPWFVPRALGDSISLMGLPETAALHPLARGAEAFYRYAITDSVRISLPGHEVRAVGIRVEPKVLGASLVAGDMWVDADRADVVRLMVTFLGEYLWDTPGEDASPEDSARVRKGNRWAQRVLTVQADLEYSLHDDRYWMPYRQLLALTVEVDFLIQGALPVRFLTTFSDYEINQDPVFAFQSAADSLEDGGARTLCPACGNDQRDEVRERVGYVRAGPSPRGRWEIVIGPADSLSAYDGWRDPLELDLSDEDAARIRRTVSALASVAEDLPDRWMGRRRFGLAWDRLADVARFNRVQGLSLGLGGEFRPGPAFTTLRGSARFGLADRRLTGALRWFRDAPGGALELSAFREVREAEPWTTGQGLGNSLNALFAGHDDADYHLALGGGVRLTPYGGVVAGTDFTLSFERHRSMSTATGSAVNDALGGSGQFPPNPTVAEGDYLHAAVAPHWRIDRVSIDAGFEALVGDTATAARAWIGATIPFDVAGRTGALSLRTGHTAADPLPQLRYRLGGPQTVRGYRYGFRTGDGFWAVQLDLALSRRWILAPVVSIDVGDVFSLDAPYDANPLVGLSAGVSALNGWLRLNLSKGLNPDEDLRFDLLFGAPR